MLLMMIHNQTFKSVATVVYLGYRADDSRYATHINGILQQGSQHNIGQTRKSWLQHLYTTPNSTQKQQQTVQMCNIKQRPTPRMIIH